MAHKKEAERKRAEAERRELLASIEAGVNEVVRGSWTDVDGVVFITRSMVGVIQTPRDIFFKRRLFAPKVVNFGDG